MTDFVKFTENNDHEGETWNFWLQVDGNEDAIAELRALIADQEDEYELAEETTPESEVDVLVKHTGMGYMRYENKVVGVLTLPDTDALDDLYKGGIKDFYKAVKLADVAAREG